MRNFSDEPVDPAAIDRILDAAKHGPSAGFTQGQDFVVVTDPARRACRPVRRDGALPPGFAPFISKPPVLIVPCTNEPPITAAIRNPTRWTSPGEEGEWPAPYWSWMDTPSC
ncbi:MAG: nitroreductase family protein [Anaerolineae bacterium]